MSRIIFLILFTVITAGDLIGQIYTGTSYRSKMTDSTSVSQVNFPSGYGGWYFYNGRIWMKDGAGYFNPRAYADAKVADAINDGVTNIAPSQNAVFDALALKQPLNPDLTAIAALSGSVGLLRKTADNTYDILTGTVNQSILHNGTNWVTFTPIQDPTTTNYDLIYRFGSGFNRLGIGSNGQALGVSSNALAYISPWLLSGGGTFSAPNTIVGSTTNTFKMQFPSIGSSRTTGAGIYLENPTAAANGAQQDSPNLWLKGAGWRSDPTAASWDVEMGMYVHTIQGTSTPFGQLRFAQNIHSAGDRVLGWFGSDATYSSKFVVGNGSSTAAYNIAFDYGNNASGQLSGIFNGTEQFSLGVWNGGTFGGSVNNNTGRAFYLYDPIATAYRLGFNASGDAYFGNSTSAYSLFIRGAGTSTGARVQLPAGTTSQPPFRFQSGSLATGGNIVAGNMEFLTDKFYATITTGTAVKEFTLNEGALTSGTIPIATTNGRLTDSGFTSTNLINGTYTPTLSNTTNVTASTAYVTGYHRIGNSVTVYGKIDIDATLAASTATELGISLPVSSNLVNEEDAGGTAVSDAIASLSARIKADGANDRVSIVFKSISLTNDSYSFQFSYQIK